MPARKIIVSSSFKRSFKRFVKNQSDLKKSIEETILKLSQDAYHKSLKTHKLSGNLFGLIGCSCGYDCRIVFRIETDIKTNSEIIILIDIGTHDEVY